MPELDATIAPLEAGPEETETALLGAALGLSALALVGAGLVGRVRREAGMA